VPIVGYRSGFRATYRIPASYSGGGDGGSTAVPVTPGKYSFATYPAGACYVSFTVAGG
jgi:hypothetical protein